MFGNKMDKVQKAIEQKKEMVLIKLAQDKDKNVCLSALEGLGKIGSDEAFNFMVPLLASSDKDFRKAAATAIGALGNAHGHAHLAFHLKSEQDADVKSAIQSALAKLRDNE